MKRDVQKSKVYAWENKVIAPRSHVMIKFDVAQQFVDGVWLRNGWLFPPTVGKMAAHAKRVWANGNRTRINIRENTPAWVILHELAHTATGTIHGDSDGHGADFMGVYLKLLETVLGIPLPLTMYTLNKTGIKYNIGAKPTWLDDHK
jgi:hypothetical protein